jgi:hypothetical protein
VSDLWFEASRDVEAESATRALTHAKIATVGVWPFLSVAESDDEFELRLDYAMPRLASLVDGETLDALLASLREDWKALRDFPEGAESPRKAANMVNTSIEDEAAAEQNSEPEGDLDHLAASLHILRITTASGSAVVIVDSATGRKVGGPYPDRPTAEQAIATGKGKGHNVKIVSAEDHAKSKKKKAAQEPPPFL